MQALQKWIRLLCKLSTDSMLAFIELLIKVAQVLLHRFHFRLSANESFGDFEAFDNSAVK